MMNDQQQALAAVRQRCEQRAQQWPVFQVKAALCLLEQRMQPPFIIHRGLPQQCRLGALCGAAVVRLPAVIGGCKTQA